MTVLLVDDEELQLLRLQNEVKKVLGGQWEYLAFTNPVEALAAAAEKSVDVAFLDIEMPVISGIGLAKKLKERNPQVNVIFVTAYQDYALDAYRLHASGYVTKPVTEGKVREELGNLRSPVPLPKAKPLQVKCFGNFEVFAHGQPVKFQYSKSKELLAYLVDREGAAVTVGELNAVLWEEDHSSYLRNLIADVQTTLKAVGAGGVFIKRRSQCYVVTELLDCDAYEYKRGNPDAVLAYRGEYMAQFSWPIFRQ